MLTAASGVNHKVVTAVNLAGVHVDDTIFEPLACADSVLRADEREMGVCLADVGAGSTSLIVFLEGAVAHTAVVPIGGDHLDRKSTRLNSSHRCISYAVFCLQKKKKCASDVFVTLATYAT